MVKTEKDSQRTTNLTVKFVLPPDSPSLLQLEKLAADKDK